MRFHAPDWHSPTHLLGSYFLTRALAWAMGVALPYAAVIAFLCGVLWELLDEEFGPITGGWLDERGGDWGDILADGIGCGLALVI